MNREETTAPAPPVPVRVLLVEDDELVAYSLAALLRRNGYRVDVAHNGRAALAAAATCRPHVALVDIGLPDMNGYEVAGRFRGDDELRGVVLVALTGRCDDESRRRGQEAGFASYLAKPVDFDGLNDVLVRAALTASAAG
jgi:DNA-binding response OmpR family regulator